MCESTTIAIIYFFYGLAFFSMGLLVAVERGRASDLRLRKALLPLAFFGLTHAVNEWLEMFELMDPTLSKTFPFIFTSGRLVILSISFLSLAVFGSFLLARDVTNQRYMLTIPIIMEAVWIFGLLALRGKYGGENILIVADVWTRYSLAIPASLLAAAGLVMQQRRFRQAGMVAFGRDALYAAVAFVWYGLFGQIFTRTTPLPPSTFLNYDLFQSIFGFPVQLFRAIMAGIASLFIIRFMRAFAFETERKIQELQQNQLDEARQREELNASLFRRVVAAQEAERQRIARDLHDETGQSLTAIGMGLRGLKSSLFNHDQPKSEQILKQLESLSNDALNELQRLIADLHPSHLDDLGLPAAIRWYANTVHERTELYLKVEIAGEEKEFSDTAKTAVFRIVQEALGNIVKHARAKNISISLQYDEAALRVRIKDDGIGFEVKDARNRPGVRPALGLAGMEERTHLLGGTFFLASLPGQGTLVEVVIPYIQPEREFYYENPSFAGG